MGAPERIAGQPALEPRGVRSAAARQGQRYHIYHPYPRRHEQRRAAPASRCRAGCINRFYYQIAIPLKDAAIMSNCPDRDVRREWIQRIIDHDGQRG